MSYCTAIETMQSEEKKALHKNYHDNHYGFPIHDDNELFVEVSSYYCLLSTNY